METKGEIAIVCFHYCVVSRDGFKRYCMEREERPAQRERQTQRERPAKGGETNSEGETDPEGETG